MSSSATLPEFPAIIPPNADFMVSYFARVPNDDVIRPSTHRSTSSVIRVAHDIEFEIKFDRLDDSLKIIGKTLAWKIVRPITITSVRLLSF